MPAGADAPALAVWTCILLALSLHRSFNSVRMCSLLYGLEGSRLRIACGEMGSNASVLPTWARTPSSRRGTLKI